MDPNESDRHKRKERRHSSNVMQNGKQEGALSPAEIASLGISAEEYELDQQVRQLLALGRGNSESRPVESALSTGRPSSHANVGHPHGTLDIFDEDLGIGRHARVANAQHQVLAKPSTNTQGPLAALDEQQSYPTRPRVRINQDSFGTLEGRKIESQQPSKPHMASNSNAMEGIESTGRSLGHQGLAGSAQLVSPAEDLPPQYEEGSFTFYQVVTRPCSQVPAGSYYSYSHLRNDEGGPRQEILNLVWEALFKLDVNMEVVQSLEDEAGYCFPLHSSRKPPFQTREWQNMVEVRKLSEDDNETWETVTPFEESALVKMCKARAQARLEKERLESSGTEVGNDGPSAGADTANNNNNVAGEPPKGEQSTRETVIVSQEVDPDEP